MVSWLGFGVQLCHLRPVSFSPIQKRSHNFRSVIKCFPSKARLSARCRRESSQRRRLPTARYRGGPGGARRMDGPLEGRRRIKERVHSARARELPALLAYPRSLRRCWQPAMTKVKRKTARPAPRMDRVRHGFFTPRLCRSGASKCNSRRKRPVCQGTCGRRAMRYVGAIFGKRNPLVADAR